MKDAQRYGLFVLENREMTALQKPQAKTDTTDCSSAIVVGINDQEQWNARISEMQEGLEFEPLVEFLERLKE